MSWSEKLARPLQVLDGPTLTTLAEGRDFMLKLDKGLTLKKEWQHAAELLLQASEKGSVKVATNALSNALFLNAMLDVR